MDLNSEELVSTCYRKNGLKLETNWLTEQLKEEM